MQHIIDYVNSIKNELISYRQHLHAHPELSWNEVETSAYITSVLDKKGISYSRISKHGICGIIQGNNADSKCIALRADMDALPIKENNPHLSYASTNPGVMHACGHDVHMACLLGAINVLHKFNNEWEGALKFIFQPSEEKQPSGAESMIQEGVLTNPIVDEIYALHVTPELETGKIGYHKGQFMASADELYITLRGAGGHAAQAYKTQDTILAASHIVVALQQIVSRNANPLIPTVISIGEFLAPGATNIIPNEVTLKGTIRTFDEEWRKNIHTRIHDICSTIAKQFEVLCEIHIPPGLPCVINNAECTNNVISILNNKFPFIHTVEMPQRMGAEDFAFYSQKIPASFFRLGTTANNQIATKLHTSVFNIDENAIPIGVYCLISPFL